MAITNQHTDQSVNFTHDPVPANTKVVSTVKRTLSGDAVLSSLQLQASSYTVHVYMTALSDMKLPSVECSYSYRTVASTEDRTAIHGGSTTNTVQSKSVNVKAGKSISSSVTFTTNGGTVTIALKGAEQGIYSATVEVYKVI
jgi:hypothetical protein